MIRRAVTTGNDSDDERVTFDDEVVGGPEIDLKEQHRIEVPASKHKHLLQYKRFKNDLDDIDEDNNTLSANWKLESSNGSKAIDFDLNSFVSKVQSKNSSTFSSSIPPKSTSSGPLNVKVPPTKVSKDVSDDRPSHWKTNTLSKAKPDPRKLVMPDAKRMKTVQTTKPLTAAPSSSVVGISNFSFQPSWMRTSNESRRNSFDNHNNCSSVVEDISEDISEVYTGNVEQQPFIDDNYDQWPPAVTLTPQRTPNGSVGLSQFHSGGSSGGKNSRRYSHGKARPGTIKAKFQKIMRDVDAAENRMLSIPPTQLPLAKTTPSSAGRTDMQDPRCRARWMVDIEILQILPDQTPFRVVIGLVLFSYRKKSAVLSPIANNNNNSINLDNGIAFNSQDMNPAVEGEAVVDNDVGIAIVSENHSVTPSKSVTMPHSLELTKSTSNMIEVGTNCTIYFKPSTCTGSGRMLREGLALRIYDPEVLRSDTSIVGENNNNIILICTQCWEQVSGLTNNSL